MTVYGADVEQLRTLSQALGRVAELLQSTTGTISRSLATTTWTGPAADQFRTEWRSTSARQLTAAATALTNGSSALLKRAWQQASVSAGGGLIAAIAATGTMLAPLNGGTGPVDSRQPGRPAGLGGLKQVMDWLQADQPASRRSLAHNLTDTQLLAEALTAGGHPPTGAACTEGNPEGLAAMDGEHDQKEVLAALSRFQSAKGLPANGELDDATRTALAAEISQRGQPYFALQPELARYSGDVIERQRQLIHGEATGTVTREEEQAAIFIHEYSRYRRGKDGDWDPHLRQWFHWADQDPKMDQLYRSYVTALSHQGEATHQVRNAPDPDVMLDHPPSWYYTKQREAVTANPGGALGGAIGVWRGLGLEDQTVVAEATQAAWEIAVGQMGDGVAKGLELRSIGPEPVTIRSAEVGIHGSP